MIVYVTLNDNWDHGGQKLVAPDLSQELCEIVHTFYYLRKTPTIPSAVSNWLCMFGNKKISIGFEPTLLFQKPGSKKEDRIFGVDGMTFLIKNDKVSLISAGYGPMPE